MASKRAQRRRACDGKRRYDTLEAALAGRGPLRALQPYKCRFCHHWHNGHPPARVRQAIADRRGTA